MKWISQPGNEHLPVPVCANAVELLAEPPAGEVLAIVPALRQQERWPSLFVAGPFQVTVLALGGNSLPCSRFFCRVAPELAQVLARPGLDRDRLVPPRRTRARVNTSHVFQDVRLCTRALHLDRFTVA